MTLSPWISEVTNHTLNMTLSTFSFQDALSLSGPGWPNSTFLFTTGCSQPDETQNCTASCLDKNNIFGSLDTLHNCMVYPTVANLYANNNLTNADLPAQYHILKSKFNSTLYNSMTNVIQTCLVDYCTTLPGCIESLQGYEKESSPSNSTSTFYMPYQSENIYQGESWFDFCEYVPQSFNQDIGGIGVMTSLSRAL